MRDSEKFNVDSDLQSIADAMNFSGLNFCGGVFDHLETGEEFELTIAKKSSVRSIAKDIEELKGKLLEHKEFTQLMHSMPTDWTVKRSIELHKETEQLLKKLNQEGKGSNG